MSDDGEQGAAAYSAELQMPHGSGKRSHAKVWINSRSNVTYDVAYRLAQKNKECPVAVQRRRQQEGTLKK
eukprot:397816-Rhodomonas_salina.1